MGAPLSSSPSRENSRGLRGRAGRSGRARPAWAGARSEAWRRGGRAPPPRQSRGGERERALREQRVDEGASHWSSAALAPAFTAGAPARGRSTILAPGGSSGRTLSTLHSREKALGGHRPSPASRTTRRALGDARRAPVPPPRAPPLRPRQRRARRDRAGAGGGTARATSGASSGTAVAATASLEGDRGWSSIRGALRSASRVRHCERRSSSRSSSVSKSFSIATVPENAAATVNARSPACARNAGGELPRVRGRSMTQGRSRRRPRRGRTPPFFRRQACKSVKVEVCTELFDASRTAAAPELDVLLLPSTPASSGSAARGNRAGAIVFAEHHDILLHGALRAGSGLVADRLRKAPLPRRRWLHRRGCMRCGDAAARRSLASMRISPAAAAALASWC